MKLTMRHQAVVAGATSIGGCLGAQAVSPDGSSLAMARVDNLQSAWRNLTLTSARCHAPPLMPSSGLMQVAGWWWCA